MSSTDKIKLTREELEVSVVISSRPILTSSKAEFCPLLDSSLVAALYSEIDSSPQSLQALRDQLETLKAAAIAEAQLITISTSQDASTSSSTSGLPSATLSDSGLGIVGSPLQFLQAAFPDLPISTLQEAIDCANARDGPIDMEYVVQELLSSELLSTASNSGDQEWKAELSSTSVRKKKEKQAVKPIKIVLGDVRHRKLGTQAKPTTPSPDQVDPWSQLASLAEYLSTLLPIPYTTILSSFHSPDFATAFDALAFQIDRLPRSVLSENQIDSDLIRMVEIINDGNDTGVDAQWARKCLQATKGRMENALDLYKILLEIKELSPIVHLKPPGIANGSTPKLVPHSPRADPVVRPPTVHVSTENARRPKQRLDTEWKVVERRRPKSPQPQSHEEFIPAHQIFKRPPSETIQKRQFDVVEQNRAIEQSWRDKRAEALRKASQQWQKGQDKFGKQVASYYADEASKYLQESKVAAMEVARAMVVRNRSVGRWR